MRKYLITIVSIILILTIVTCNVFATTQGNANVSSNISFSGSTATCTTSVYCLDEDIDVNMELWNGTTLLCIWTANGHNRVSMTKTYTVVPGLSYTLKVSGSTQTSTFTAKPVTKVCP